ALGVLVTHDGARLECPLDGAIGAQVVVDVDDDARHGRAQVGDDLGDGGLFVVAGDHCGDAKVGGVHPGHDPHLGGEGEHGGGYTAGVPSPRCPTPTPLSHRPSSRRPHPHPNRGKTGSVRAPSTPPRCARAVRSWWWAESVSSPTRVCTTCSCSGAAKV